MCISVLIVEDTASFRDLVSDTLKRGPSDIVIVGETDNAEDAVRIVREQQPNFVVMDLKIFEFVESRKTEESKGKHGISAIRRIRHWQPDSKILALSQYGKGFGEPVIVAALLSGIDGYLRKDDPDVNIIRELPSLLMEVNSGYAVYDKHIARIMLKYAPANYISNDNNQVLKLIADGHTNDEIANRLKLTLKTIHLRKRNIINSWKQMEYDDIMERFEKKDVEELL